MGPNHKLMVSRDELLRSFIVMLFSGLSIPKTAVLY